MTELAQAFRAGFHRLLRSGLDAVPLVVWEKIVAKDVLCVNYHVLSDTQLPHVRHYPYKSAGVFEKDLRFVARKYGFIDYPELLNLRTGAVKSGKKNRVFITFDDGFSECYTTARPILMKLGVPCAFFVVVDLVDNKTVFYESAVSLCLNRIETLDIESAVACIKALGISDSEPVNKIVPGHSRLQIKTDLSQPAMTLVNWVLGIGHADSKALFDLCRQLQIDIDGFIEKHQPYMSSEQIQQLDRDGFTIGAHGLSHRKMTNLPANELEEEIVAACEYISKLTGKSQIPFAFPWTGIGINRQLLADIRTRNPVVGLYFDTGKLSVDAAHIVHRVSGDIPDPGRPDESNLQQIIKAAWSNRWSWWAHPMVQQEPKHFD